MKNRRTSTKSSVEVCVKESVESTEYNRLKEEVVQIQREEEWKDSCNKLREDNERKQPEIIPMNKEMKKKNHSSDKKSKSRRTVTKSPNHGKTPIKTQEKNSENRVKRPGGEKEEVVLRHTESKRVRLEEEVMPIEPKEVSPSTKVESSLLEEKKDCELPCDEVKKKEKESERESSIVITSCLEQNVDSPYVW